MSLSRPLPLLLLLFLSILLLYIIAFENQCFTWWSSSEWGMAASSGVNCVFLVFGVHAFKNWTEFQVKLCISNMWHLFWNKDWYQYQLVISSNITVAIPTSVSRALHSEELTRSLDQSLIWTSNPSISSRHYYRYKNHYYCAGLLGE